MVSQKTEVPTYLNIGKILVYAMYAYVMFGIIVLGLRIFLLAFSASTEAGFVNFIYRTSSDFLQPFRGIFPPHTVGETGYLDVSAMFAMIIYGMIAMGFSSLIGYIQSKINEYNKS